MPSARKTRPIMCWKSCKSRAAIVAHRPWADGKMAYPVKGHKKALHLLTYFTMPASGLTEVTRQVHLSESILRHMVLKHPKVLFDAMVNALSGKEGTFRHVENVDEAPRPARRGREEETPPRGLTPWERSNSTGDRGLFLRVWSSRSNDMWKGNHGQFQQGHSGRKFDS